MVSARGSETPGGDGSIRPLSGIGAGLGTGYHKKGSCQDDSGCPSVLTASSPWVKAFPGMNVVEARELRFSIRGTQILAPLSFSVKKGEFVAFIGPSGCGKTTLLNLVAGIRKGHGGVLTVEAEKISFVFQHDSLLEWQTVIGNILLPFTLKNYPVTDEIRQRAERILGLVGLAKYGHFFPHQLSGGMKKRVEIARALVTEPSLLILDEPFSSLDLLTRERLNLLIKKIHQLRKTTVVLVTHSVEEACFLADRIYVLSPLPARIVEVREPAGPETEADPPPGLYVLSPRRQEMNTRIREEAKYLWDAEGAGAAAVPEHSGPEAEPPRVRDRLRAAAARLGRNWNRLLIPVEMIGLYLLLGFVKERFAVPDLIFPAPRAILAKFASTLADGTILRDLRLTVTESLSGFFIAFGLGMVLGFILAKSRFMSRLLMPYFIGANTIPSVALAPFLVLWFGFGLTPRIVTSVILVFFPLLINIIAAFRHSEDRVRSLVSFYRPTRLRSLTAMEFPAALPGIFSGIKISITLSVIGAVVGEFVSGHEGLGALVTRAKASFDVELMFVALLWLIALGLFYYGLASASYRLIRKRLETPRLRKRKGASP